MLEALSSWLAAEGIEWASMKAGLQPMLNISHDALHVVLGVLVQLVAAAITRSSLSRALPWLVVFGLELINEINDIKVERWPTFAMQLGEGVKDTLLTMLLPTILLILVRMQPRLFRAR